MIWKVSRYVRVDVQDLEKTESNFVWQPVKWLMSPFHAACFEKLVSNLHKVLYIVTIKGNVKMW